MWQPIRIQRGRYCPSAIWRWINRSRGPTVQSRAGREPELGRAGRRLRLIRDVQDVALIEEDCGRGWLPGLIDEFAIARRGVPKTSTARVPSGVAYSSLMTGRDAGAYGSIAKVRDMGNSFGV